MSREYPPRPIVGIGVVVLRPGEVLLVRRGQAPNLGAWSLPGGGQELGETVEETARRELLEETALTVGPLLFVAHIDAIHRDQAGRVQYHYTILDFAARWDAGDPVAGGDITEVAWAGYESLAAYTLTRDARRVIEVGRRLLDL